MIETLEKGFVHMHRNNNFWHKHFIVKNYPFSYVICLERGVVQYDCMAMAYTLFHPNLNWIYAYLQVITQCSLQAYSETQNPGPEKVR